MANIARLANAAEGLSLQWDKLTPRERALVWDELRRRAKKLEISLDEIDEERRERIDRAMRRGRAWRRRTATDDASRLAHDLEASAYTLGIGVALGMVLTGVEGIRARPPSPFRMLASVCEYIEFRQEGGERYDADRFKCRLTPPLLASVNVLTPDQATVAYSKVCEAIRHGPASQRQMLRGLNVAGEQALSRWPGIGRTVSRPFVTSFQTHEAPPRQDFVEDTETLEMTFDRSAPGQLPG